MGKLVRDRIPEIIRAEGRTPRVRVLEGEEYGDALRAKLREEVDELLSADPGGVLEEAVDVYEVLLALIRQAGCRRVDLFSAASSKRTARGAFYERLWWEGEAGPRRDGGY